MLAGSPVNTVLLAHDSGELELGQRDGEGHPP